MAKTTKTNNEIRLVSEELETALKSNLKNTPKAKVTPKEDKVEVEIVETNNEPVKKPVKMVKILMNDNHKCCVGGEWYYLLKDKHYNVPENVKDILLRANKLRPL